MGQWGAYKVQSTPTRSVPEPPKILHLPVQEEDGEESIVTSPYADQFELRWNVPADNGEPIDYYQVSYCPVSFNFFHLRKIVCYSILHVIQQGGKVNGIWSEVENLCNTRDYIEFSNFELRDLSADTYYRVELRAHNAIGYSSPTHFLLKSARGESSHSFGTMIYQAGYGSGSSITSSSVVLKSCASLLFYLCCSVLVFVRRF